MAWTVSFARNSETSATISWSGGSSSYTYRAEVLSGGTWWSKGEAKGASGSISFTLNENIAYSARLVNLNSTSGESKSGTIPKYTTPTPSYTGSISNAGSYKWFQNTNYIAQGSAKLTITTSGASSGFYITVSGYQKDVYTNSSCSEGKASSFGALNGDSRYIILDNLFDGQTSSSYVYTVKLYAPDDTFLDSVNVYRQKITGICANGGVRQHTATIAWQVSSTSTKGWRLYIDDNHLVTLSGSSGTTTLSSLINNTQYTIKLQYKDGDGIWNTVDSVNVTTISPYTITINYRDASSPTLIYQTKTLSRSYEETVAKSSVTSLIPDGYEFSDASVEFPYTVTGTATISVYISIKKYTLTYYANYTGSTQDPVTQSKTHGVKVTIKGSSTFSRTDYIIDYWIGSDGINYSLGEEYTANADINLYAHWKATTYTATLTLYGNNGKWNNNTTYTDSATVQATLNKTWTLSDYPEPTRAGYKFIGYYGNSSGTGSRVYVLNSSKSNPDVSAYAQWLPTIPKFYWLGSDSADNNTSTGIMSGNSINYLKATQWNALIDKIHTVETAFGLSNSSLTKVSSGTAILASYYNQLANAINNIITQKNLSISKVSTVSKGTPIKATHFNYSSTSLKGCINNIIEYYNTH